jgi:Raf kinase inhibitor-like YbhB/YbcL family protein
VRGLIRCLSALTLVVAVSTGCGTAPVPSSSPPANVKEDAQLFTLSSPAFSAGQQIPTRFAMQGVPGAANTSIPYVWSGAPATTKSFALVLIDTAPIARDWVHWAVVDIPPTASAIAEGASGTSAIPAGARELANTFGSLGYGGPKPPPGSGPHSYVATIYALDTPRLGITGAVSAASLARAFEGHVLAQATLTGHFER